MVSQSPLLSRRSLLLAGAGLALTPLPALAADKSKALVEKAALTIEKLMVDPDMPELRRFVAASHGVLVIPQLVKGGFIIGGEGGVGVMLTRGADKSWSYPAFYTLAAASIGLQFGGEVKEVVFTFMNDGAISAVLNDQFKLGADASIAVGPFGKGVEASTTTNFSEDIYAFSKSVGLFGGGAFEGAAILKDDEMNASYYGSGASPRAILVERSLVNPHADRLRGALG